MINSPEASGDEAEVKSSGVPPVKEESWNALNICVAEVVKDGDEVLGFDIDEDDDEVLEF